jgi:hypothetical protein
MSDTHNQPAQQPRGGATARGTAAAARADAADRPGTAMPAAATRGGYVPRPAPGYDDAGATDRQPRGAALGLTMFAATFMMVSGVLGFFEGLAAVIRGRFFTVLPRYAFSLSATSRGWVLIILSALVFLAGVALFADRMWARITGVVLAAFSLVANFVFLPYYPVWAIVVIAADAFVIWALLAPRGHRA